MESRNFTNLARLLAQGKLQYDTSVDGSADTFKVMLVSSIPSESNFDTWIYRSDVTNEITGIGYTSGGIDQPYTFDSIDIANNRQPITYSNIINGWTNATITAAGAIVYKNTDNINTDLLMHFVDFGNPISCYGGTFSLIYSSPYYINS